MQLTISGLGSGQISSHAELAGAVVGEAPRALTELAQGIDLKQVSSSSVDVGTNASGGTRYFNVVYQVRNAQYCATPGSCPAYGSATQNLTLIAADTAGNLGGSAVAGLFRFDASAEPASLALGILPTHGTQLDGAGTGVLVLPGYESLQVYTESEVAGIPRDAGATGLFPYGYVVKNVHSSASRSLPANPAANQWDGQLAFSFKLPLQPSSKDDPYSITLLFEVVDDANTRVTQSAEEQDPVGDLVATARAAALGGADLAVLGGRVAQTNIGDPICTVRTAGTAAAPTAWLANNGSGTNAVTASGPNSLQNLPTNTPVTVGFCTPMNNGAYGTMVVRGSQSGLRGAVGYNGSYAVSGVNNNRIAFTPSQPFWRGETVSYTLTTGLTDTGAHALATPFVGSFTVGGLVASSATLAAGSSIAVGAQPYSVAIGDFDLNTQPDLAVANNNNNTVSILLGNGSGGFSNAPGSPIAVGSSPEGIAVGDFNGDGRPDLAVANYGSGNVSILLGNGDGTFQAAVNSGVAANPGSIVVGDFNGDGKLDLATVNRSNVSILLGKGDGTFQSVVTYGAGYDPFFVAAGDFNGDGKTDLAVANYSGSSVSILLGKGDGSFQGAVSYSIGQRAYSVAVGDFNGDGKPDLVASGYSITGSGFPPPNPATLSILLGQGDGTFAPAVNTTIGPSYGNGTDVAVGDLNGDGKADLAMVDSQNGYVAILLGKGDGTFSAASGSPVSAGNQPLAVALGDLNRDGKLDLAVANYGSNNVNVFLGQ